MMPADTRSTRSRRFRLVWTSDALSAFGSQVSGLVIPLVALTALGASSIQVGALVAATWLPWVVLGLPMGVWVDTHDRRRLALVTSLIRAVLLIIPVILGVLGILSMFVLLGIALALGTLSVIGETASQSLLPLVVDKEYLVRANARLQGVRAVLQVAAPAAGGALVQAFSGPFALLLDSACCTGSAVALGRIRLDEAQNRGHLERRRPMAEAREGLAWLLRGKVFRAGLVVTASSNLTISAFTVLSLIYLTQELGLQGLWIGVLLAAGSVGAVIAAAGVGTLAARVGQGPVMRWSLLLTSVVALVVGLSGPGPRVIFFGIAQFSLMGGAVTFGILWVSYRQETVPVSVLGRVTACSRAISYASVPLGGLVGGAIGQAWRPGTGLTVVLLVNVLPALWFAAHTRALLRGRVLQIESV